MLEKNNKKVNQVILFIIIGILFLSTIILAGTTIYYANNKETPKEATGLIRAISYDSTLVDNNAYVQIDNDTYEFDIPEASHELICKRILVGGENVTIHTSLTCHIIVYEYALKKSEATTFYDSEWNNIDEYSFTTNAGMSYYIEIRFGQN